MSKEVTRTEQGWPGHFICGHRCVFHRNTLLTRVGSNANSVTKIIVSTVGDMQPPDNLLRSAAVPYDLWLLKQIGAGRYYETMVFYAIYEKPYWHADVQRQIDLHGLCSIPTLEYEDDMKANEMHEAAIVEIEDRMKQGVL